MSGERRFGPETKLGELEGLLRGRFVDVDLTLYRSRGFSATWFAHGWANAAGAGPRATGRGIAPWQALNDMLDDAERRGIARVAHDLDLRVSDDDG